MKNCSREDEKHQPISTPHKMNVALSAEIVKILESMFKIFFGSVLTFLNVKGLQLQLVFLPKL